MTKVNYDKLKGLSPQEQVNAIRRAYKYNVYDKPIRHWLDTGNEDLNGVLGSPKRGIAYGKCLVLAGMQSSGKTLVAAKLAGLAQQDGAVVGWVDAEDSFDGNWVRIHGLDPGKPIRDDRKRIIGYTKIALFKPQFGVFKKTRKLNAGLRLETAEELVQVASEWMVAQRAINKNVRLCMVVDSTTALCPEEEMAAGFTEQNMKTKMSNAPFLNGLTKNWMLMAPNVNAIVIYISQLRLNPSAFMSDPEYMPGGKGLYFYPHVHVKVRRVKGGLLKQGGKIVGVKSVMVNKKNKTGGGSIEGLSCAYKAYFQKSPWKIMSIADIKKDEAE